MKELENLLIDSKNQIEQLEGDLNASKEKAQKLTDINNELRTLFS